MHELTHGLDCGSTISEPVACPIATNVAMDRTSSCDYEHDHERVSQLERDEFLYTSMLIVSSQTSQLSAMRVARRHLLIAMMIANKYLDRDESHEQASSDATRVAMDYRVFDRDKRCDVQPNLQTRERRMPNARRLAWTDH